MAFQWDDHFTTGLQTVDQQHHHLVDLINNLQMLVVQDKVEFSSIERLYTELAEYANYHFREEQLLLKQHAVDQRHAQHHLESHREFLEDVSVIYSQISGENYFSGGRKLLDFLTHWLTYHILGEDQNMSRQIGLIQSGMEPAAAYDTGQKSTDVATGILLKAVNGLFEMVSERNKELILLNRSLEEKVEDRTRELRKANLLFEELSLTDPLTKLPNRRHAMQCLSTLWQESVAGDFPLACIMIDADHFKEVNDQHGHDAGDEVLSVLARTLQHTFRNDDVVCRLGGDEFLAICSKTGIRGGLHIAEQACNEVSKLNVHANGASWQGNISAGVACRTAEMKNFEELIKLADQAVYAAKQAGKNCAKTVG